MSILFMPTIVASHLASARSIEPCRYRRPTAMTAASRIKKVPTDTPCETKRRPAGDRFIDRDTSSPIKTAAKVAKMIDAAIVATRKTGSLVVSEIDLVRLFGGGGRPVNSVRSERQAGADGRADARLPERPADRPRS